MLPLTERVLGQRFAALFGRYAPTAPLNQGTKKHWDDALAFADFLIKTLRQEASEPHWLMEVARYEQAWLQAAATGSLTARWFRFAIRALMNSLARGETTPLLVRRPTLALWVRTTRPAHLRHLLLTLPGLLRRRLAPRV